MGGGSEDFKGIKQLSARNGRRISPHQQSKRGKETIENLLMPVNCQRRDSVTILNTELNEGIRFYPDTPKTL